MTSKIFLPLPLAGEGRGEGKPLSVAFALLLATIAACGNYSNEDLEFLNAVPAAEDISADIPRALMPANEAELARLTHDTVNLFNGALEFLKAADVIRTYPATTRVPNGRIWGPVQMEEHPAWQWRFKMTRAPDRPEAFDYSFDIEPFGAGPDDWSEFIKGSFVAVNGVRKGIGHFEMKTGMLLDAGFPVGANLKGETLDALTVDYSTETFPINVKMTVSMWTNPEYTTGFTVTITYEAQANGQGAIQFDATDSAGNSISVTSRWLATGRGRADASVNAGPVMGQTRTQCWNDAFEETFNNVPWDPTMNSGRVEDCPDISTL